MKRIIAVLDLLPKRCPENVRQSYEAAAERWDAEVLWLTKSLCNASAISQKVMVCNEVAKRFGPSHVLQLDNDMLIRSDCPSIFDLVSQDKFAMITCFQGVHRRTDQSCWSYRAHQKWARFLNLPLAPAWLHPNGGLYLYNTVRFGGMFERLNDTISQRRSQGVYCCDEGLIITQLWHDKPDAIEYFPLQFNTTLHQHDAWAKIPVMQSYVYHFVAQTKRHLEACRWKRSDTPELPYPENWWTNRLLKTIGDKTKLHLVVDRPQHAKTIANLLSFYPDLEISFEIKPVGVKICSSAIVADQFLQQVTATHTVHLLLKRVLELTCANASRLTYLPQL